MKTGIEKFKDIVPNQTCDLLIDHIEKNMDKAADMQYHIVGDSQTEQVNNVICRQLVLEKDSELDKLVYKCINKALFWYSEKYQNFIVTGDTGYQLRKITGKTRAHVDGIYDGPKIRNVSVILGLNSDYEGGEFHFPFQDFSTTVKRGEAIVFPVYFLYPHSVDAPIGNRYTINTWATEDYTGHVRSSRQLRNGS
tara:strand:+ start:106 stop:690 length:585 start_codon:yes stop_codon:yes gene_type:complete